MTTLLWLVLPYLALAGFVLGHVWRWRHDQFGWTTFTTQLVENRLLRWDPGYFTSARSPSSSAICSACWRRGAGSQRSVSPTHNSV